MAISGVGGHDGWSSAWRWALGNGGACLIPAALGYGLMRLVRVVPARAQGTGPPTTEPRPRAGRAVEGAPLVPSRQAGRPHHRGRAQHRDRRRPAGRRPGGPPRGGPADRKRRLPPRGGHRGRADRAGEPSPHRHRERGERCAGLPHNARPVPNPGLRAIRPRVQHGRRADHRGEPGRSLGPGPAAPIGRAGERLAASGRPGVPARRRGPDGPRAESGPGCADAVHARARAPHGHAPVPPPRRRARGGPLEQRRPRRLSPRSCWEASCSR
ncbi:MAG: hypothetical protein QOK40_1366 [Miltoncostaeaceae bacterium]|nr:hypothetical protein [Miltoncostaeaceae bacterium]